jgi:anti-sigma regulatory factor (Ser/Thr protein kinase)
METIHVNASKEEIGQVFDFVNSELEAAGADLKMRMKIQLAVEEIYVNIASYAYPAGAQNFGADVAVDVKDGVARIIFKDRGLKYNPLEKEDPDVTLAANERQIGGLGIFMVKKMMDDVLYEYRYEDGANILTLIKNL